jgi:hypothetical protein
LSFRTCKQCGKEWAEREDFFADPELVLSGCQVDVEAPAVSAFLFDHKVPGCGTTLAVPVRAFDDLWDGPRHKVKWGLSAKCAGKCHDPHNLEDCSNECAAAYVRHILQIILERSRGDGAGG